MKKKLWLTGASGFLGSWLIKSPIVETYDVTAIVREPRALPIRQKTLEDLKVSGEVAEVIVHAATEYARGGLNLGNLVEANISLPIRLIDLSRETLTHFITIDSYYNKEAQIYPYLPQYCISKRLLMNWLDLEFGDIAVSRVYLEHVYGPNDRSDKFVPYVIEKLKRDETVELSTGVQERDFIYVEDAADAVYKITKRVTALSERAVFEVGSGVTTSINDFVRLAKLEASSRSEIRNFVNLDRSNEIMSSVANLEALSAIGWRPKISLREGIRMLLESS
jgi:CDP-paratose synthetase